jgi:adenylate cyclase
LDVSTILVPTLQKEGKRIRISAQLTNVQEDFIIESYTFEEEFKSVFEVQDNISKSIAGVLEVRLVEDRFKAIKKLEPKDSAAYESYIRGVHFERKYKDAYRQKDFEEAVRHYEKAVEIDENYALAYCGLGNVYEAHFVAEKDQKDLDSMLQNYMRAYEIDPDLAETNVALGWAYFYKEDLDKAYQYFKRGFEIAPNKPDINFNVGGFLRSIGLHHNAIKYYLRAIELNPLSILYRRLCAACYSRTGEFEEAALHLKKALEFEPDDAGLRLYYARQLIMMKEYERAEEEIKKAENLDPKEPDIQYTRAIIYATEGKKEEALAIIEGKNPYYFTSLFSKVYSLLGMKDEAIENISKAIDRGFYEVQTFLQSYLVLKSDHYLDSLRDDPRFREIMKKQKKSYEEYLKKYGDL